MSRIKKHELFIIIFVAFFVVLPFINQAYYIDDFIYLTAAIEYNSSGFEAFHGMSDQEGVVVPNYYLTHPLVWPWFLSVFIKLFNTTNEVALHIISIINLIIIGISSLLISKRYSQRPLIVTIFLLILPSIMLLSHVVMTDIPTLAFFLLSLALHIDGIEKKSRLYLCSSGLAATIAIGISYQALFIVALIIFYNIQKKEKQPISYISSIVPLIFFVIWFAFTWWEFGIPHPLVSFQWGDTIVRHLLLGFLPKFISNINVLGATTIFPLFIFCIYTLNKRFRNLLIIALFISILMTFLFVSEYTLPQKLLFNIYFSAGLFIILRFITFLIDSVKRKDKNEIFLSIWFISFFAAIVILMPIGVARYLFPAFLPLIIIVVNDILEIIKSEKFKYVISVGLFVTTFWGVLCSISDYTLAGIYRNFSEEIADKYQKANVWFSSDGLQWYMKKEGFKPLLYGYKGPVKGDIVVMSTELWAYYVPEVMERTELLDEITIKSTFPIRTMNQSSNAGFHDNLQGLLPFSITRQPFEKFYIYRVTE